MYCVIRIDPGVWKLPQDNQRVSSSAFQRLPIIIDSSWIYFKLKVTTSIIFNFHKNLSLPYFTACFGLTRILRGVEKTFVLLFIFNLMEGKEPTFIFNLTKVEKYHLSTRTYMYLLVSL